MSCEYIATFRSSAHTPVLTYREQGTPFQDRLAPVVNGETLAREFAARIANKEITVGKIDSADIGWHVSCSIASRKLSFLVGLDPADRWVLFCRSEETALQRWRRDPIDPYCLQLAISLHDALSSTEEISDLRWHKHYPDGSWVDHPNDI